MSTQNQKRLKKITVAIIENMSDAELEAASDGANIDLSGFTDRELIAILHDTAGPELLARVAAVTTYPGAPA